MRRFFVGLLLGISVLGGGMLMPEARADKPTSKQSRGMTPVAQKLEAAGYFTESKARPGAQYYIFICSASWCGPCRALMPQVVKEYEDNMKRDKSVSMVLLGCDSDVPAAQKYIEHYKTDMPGVLKSAVNFENAPQIAGIPWYFILNSEGALVSSGAGPRVLEWKTLIENAVAQNPALKKAAGSPRSGASPAELKIQCKSWHSRNMKRAKSTVTTLARVKNKKTAEKAATALRALFENADGEPKDECPDEELYEELYPMDNEQVNSYARKLGRQLLRISNLVEDEKVDADTFAELEEVCRNYTRYLTEDDMEEAEERSAKEKKAKWKKVQNDRK